MNARFASLLTVVTGVLVLKLTLTGGYLNYVRPGMYPWLIASGMFLILLGVTGRLRDRGRRVPRRSVEDPAHHHGHGLSRAAWLLVLPVLAATLWEPAPLGSFAASRQTVRPPRLQPPSVERVSEQVAGLQPAPQASPATEVAGLAVPMAGDNSEMSLLDFLEITYYDDSKALAGVPVNLVGFVAPAPAGGSGEFLLSRFMISCCAADAQLLQVLIAPENGSALKPDSWVKVTGAWAPDEGPGAMTVDGFPIPRLVATGLTPVSQPENPYLTLAQ